MNTEALREKYKHYLKPIQADHPLVESCNKVNENARAEQFLRGLERKMGIRAADDKTPVFKHFTAVVPRDCPCKMVGQGAPCQRERSSHKPKDEPPKAKKLKFEETSV